MALVEDVSENIVADVVGPSRLRSDGRRRMAGFLIARRIMS
jgi:hypothetical protein